MKVIDLHCHTIEGSRCSHLSAADMVKFYQKQGYAGFCVTDHFTGSTTVPEGTPWEERIDRYFDRSKPMPASPATIFSCSA